MAAPPLPTSFPCWVKAVYSWGGETKGDLGFMEGDLIECLNAGNGSWWMGRLKRDKRMAGLFPSNFVQVLEDYQPTPPRGSPKPIVNGSATSSRQSSQTTSTPTTPSPQKSRGLFRKPFTAYAQASSPNPQALAREALAKSKEGTPSPPSTGSKSWKPKPYSSMKNTQQVPSQTIAPSPLRPPSPTIPAPIARSTSPTPTRSTKVKSRAASPLPQYTPSRATSPAPQFDNEQDSSPPPPPPPAHRVAYTRPTTPDPQYKQNYMDAGTGHDNGYLTPQERSPAGSDQHTGLTPSPLRDAMNDVMSSLQDMGMSQRSPSPSPEKPRGPSYIWSPDSFAEVYQTSSRQNRPHTSMGIAGEDFDDDGPDEQVSQNGPFRDFEGSEAGYGESYVQRMESRLREMQRTDDVHEYFAQNTDSSPPPAPPAKDSPFDRQFSRSRPNSRPGSSYGQQSRPGSSYGQESSDMVRIATRHELKKRKSAYELGREKLSRTLTGKSTPSTASSAAQSSSTNSSQSTQMTSQSLMSGYSAGGFSATSAGSLARRKFGKLGSLRHKERPQSVMGIQRPATAMSAVSYQSSHDSGIPLFNDKSSEESAVGGLGGLTTPTAKKRGFLKKMIDSAKTGTASVRSNISTAPSSRPGTPHKSVLPDGVTAISGGLNSNNAAKEMGLNIGSDWVQMRRDVNRSNSLSQNERNERKERCEMADLLVLNPVDIFNDSVEGDEAADGAVVSEPTEFTVSNLALVDKGTRFLNNLPAMINPISLAQSYLCRPYRSDVQKLRAIFTWVAERIAWEEDFEGDIDTRRVIHTKRGCSEEIAVLVMQLCSAVGIHAEVIQGYLKAPGEGASTHERRPNHWWNAVISDGEWRMMDCSLAGPTNPKRNAYSSAGNQVAETWWFLARPMEICYTHVPVAVEQQHIVPPQQHEILMALPVATPPYFKNNIRMWDFDTSLIHLDGLEMAHIQLAVPDDVECVAEVESHAFARDADGDFFESGEIVKKRALAQGEFVNMETPHGPTPAFKRYTIKAVLPASTRTTTLSSNAVLNIYVGRRGLTHSINSNPHPLALALPLSHQGQNPDYDFFARHPTPHALRHELYVTGPLCKRLAINSTFVFSVRQHPATTAPKPPDSDNKSRPASPIARPSSALSSISGSAYSIPSRDAATSSSNYSNESAGGTPAHKPAKLAIQSPSGKILRMTRKMEVGGGGAAGTRRSRAKGRGEEEACEVQRVGSAWETIIKIGERGVWRGLVLADRSARWCVFGEWEAV